MRTREELLSAAQGLTMAQYMELRLQRILKEGTSQHRRIKDAVAAQELYELYGEKDVLKYESPLEITPARASGAMPVKGTIFLAAPETESGHAFKEAAEARGYYVVWAKSGKDTSIYNDNVVLKTEKAPDIYVVASSIPFSSKPMPEYFSPDEPELKEFYAEVGSIFLKGNLSCTKSSRLLVGDLNTAFHAGTMESLLDTVEEKIETPGTGQANDSAAIGKHTGGLRDKHTQLHHGAFDR